MPTITRFEDIEAWKTARELTRIVYSLTEQGEFSRDFGLKNQIQRASVSVMSNIAEDFESRTQAQILEYLGRSKALKYLSQEQFNLVFDLADKSSRQLARFMDYLETHPQSRRVRDESSEYEV